MFLASKVYRLIISEALVHDAYNCRFFGASPWPTKRQGDCFVGGFECNSSNKFYECPMDCRPPEHPDWISC